MLPLVMAALGIITDRNSTDYWYQSKALPAQTVCLSFRASFHTLNIICSASRTAGICTRVWFSRVCTNLDFHCFLISKADVKGVLSRFRETIFQEEVSVTILPWAGSIGVHF